MIFLSKVLIHYLHDKDFSTPRFRIFMNNSNQAFIFRTTFIIGPAINSPILIELIAQVPVNKKESDFLKNKWINTQND